MEDHTRVKSISSATIHAPIEDVKVDHENGSHQPGFETISAQKTSDHTIKRTYFPGIIDILEVTDPAEIRTISNEMGIRFTQVAAICSMAVPKLDSRDHNM